MNSATLSFVGETLTALPSGALFWERLGMLVVSDLHLGKSERIARRGGTLLPPYDTTETLTRLQCDIEALKPLSVLCLGDSFDDRAAALALQETHHETLQRLQAGRDWIWVEGNHDPGPIDLGGAHRRAVEVGPITFRHIAEDDAGPGEVSGHYHPKASLRAARRPCFMCDDHRLILPAYGAYTGGLDWMTPTLRNLFGTNATAFLTGRRVLTVPVPQLV